METPDRSKTLIAAPMSKFEDSPIFNFLNNLSPIKPVKSIQDTHTLDSLSFASSPSVFTSPSVRFPKEYRFLKGHQLGDQSKPEFSRDNVDKDDTNKVIVDGAPNTSEDHGSFNPFGSSGASTQMSYGCSKLAADNIQIMNRDLGSSSCSQTATDDLNTKIMSEVTGSLGAVEPYVKEEYNEVFEETGTKMEAVRQIDQKKERVGSDWELSSDDTNLLIYNSRIDTSVCEAYEKSMDQETSVCDSIYNAQASVAVDCGEGELDNQPTQPQEGNVLEEVSESKDIRGNPSLGVNCVTGAAIDSVDLETVSNLNRGMRRRCLVFEQSEAHQMHLNENQLVPENTKSESSGHALLGIGLHLNALSTTSNDFNVVKNEAFASGRQLLIKSGSATNHHSLNTGLDCSSNLVIPMHDRQNSTLARARTLEENGPASGYLAPEEYSQSSPTKKRCRLDNGEVGACKRCNCKKSKCLKLYCECFAAGVCCVEPCSCVDCFNKPIHEDIIIATRKKIESRNPLAFAPKVIRTFDPLGEPRDESRKTPASARHKRGCNCKKSGCLKKYCECYQSGVGCSINCRCEGCGNAFGRKDGFALTDSEVELEEEEMEATEKSLVNRNQPKALIRSESDWDLATPLGFCRPSVQHQFQSTDRPRWPTSVPVGSSSALWASQGFGKPSFPLPQSKFDKSFGTVQEDEMPEILQTNGSPMSGVKSASPNSKRIFPHCGSGTPPGQRISRKLILQSIPSIPSLTLKR